MYRVRISGSDKQGRSVALVECDNCWKVLIRKTNYEGGGNVTSWRTCRPAKSKYLQNGKYGHEMTKETATSVFQTKIGRQVKAGELA